MHYLLLVQHFKVLLLLVTAEGRGHRVAVHLVHESCLFFLKQSVGASSLMRERLAVGMQTRSRRCALVHTKVLLRGARPLLFVFLSLFFFDPLFTLIEEAV